MERHKKIERTPEQLDGAVAAFVKRWDYASAGEAKSYLVNYALNRLATLERNEAKKPKKPAKKSKKVAA
jgi:hypothetical protein